jgi:hypothetical protein
VSHSFITPQHQDSRQCFRKFGRHAILLTSGIVTALNVSFSRPCDQLGD